MRQTLVILSFVLVVLAPGMGRAGDAPTIEVVSAGSSIGAHATIRIRATREVIWAIVSSCPEALKIVPSLRECEVLERAPDGSWERILQVMEYFRFLPNVRFEVRVNYRPPASVTFERVSGDLTSLRGEWTMQTDGDYTIAHYDIAIEPGLWVPRWIVRAALKHDLPKMLQALRSDAETTRPQNLG
jgi:Polyketide cyclase / dehydrase and lipid transport